MGADIAFDMAQFFGERMGAHLTDSTPLVLAWRDRVSQRPAVRTVLRPMIDFLTLKTGGPVRARYPECWQPDMVPATPNGSCRLMAANLFGQREVGPRHGGGPSLCLCQRVNLRFEAFHRSLELTSA